MLTLAAVILMTQADPFAPRPVTFSHVPPPETKSVAVVGTFNNWDRAAFPLEQQGDRKTWKGTFKVAPGVYSYLFVENGNKWLPDPKAPPYPDANGNVNSKLVVEPADYEERPASPEDGHITLSALRHRPTTEDCVLLNARSARIKLRTRRGDAKAVGVIHGGEAESKDRRHGLRGATGLERIAQDDLFDTWAGTISVSLADPTAYHFSIVSGERGWYFGSLGLDRPTPFKVDFRKYPLPNPPDWVQDAVFYQIFPERFANGNSSNDGPEVQPWGAKPTGQNRMGGDLSGIVQKIGHLKELGVTGLYLNPIFEALSNHAYDTVAYDRVDPRFGTNEDLAQLIGDLRTAGIRTILDGVFNHSSPEFKAFKDVREKGSASPYKDWYFISGFPVEVKEGQKHYRTFAGVPTMPKLNQDNAVCRDYFLGVGEKWIREAGAAGWRLDVADEVSQDFWREFRKRVKRVDKDAFILGEVWGDAHEYLQGDQHDSVMNYRWRRAGLDFFALGKTNAEEFDRELRLIRDDYPVKSLTYVFNLLGSHDTERLRTVFKGNRARQMLAVVFQFTYPGVPSIYYGDEIGMEGGKDPDCRRCMEWDRSKWDLELFELYKKLIALRKQHSALREGDFTMLEANPQSGLLLFARQSAGERITVALNAGKAAVELPAGAGRSLLLDKGLKRSGGQTTLAANGFALWKSPF